MADEGLIDVSPLLHITDGASRRCVLVKKMKLDLIESVVLQCSNEHGRDSSNVAVFETV
jgi:hypothetical protein